jgi:hypothetical protein
VDENADGLDPCRFLKFVSKAVDENADGLDPCCFLKFCKQIVLSDVPCFSNLQLQGCTLNGLGGSSTCKFTLMVGI